VRQWVLSLPIPLRLLPALQPTLLSPVLQVVHRVLPRFLIERAGLKPSEAGNGEVTLLQRFGSADNLNLNMHLHCLVMDGVYQRGEAGPVFLEVRVPRSNRKLQIRVFRTGRSGTPASGRSATHMNRA
jgi:hypothetical protein